MSVLVDIHESLAVRKSLQKRGIDTEEMSKSVADIQIDKFGFERKSITDLLLSSRSIKGQPPRLWGQLFRLKQAFPNRAALCITGTPEDVIRKGFEFNYSKYMSIKARCWFGGLHVPALEFKDEDDLALFISKGYEVLNKPSSRPVPYTPSKAPDKVVVENMICQVHGIGLKTTKRILIKCANSIAHLCTKSEEEIVEVIGIKGKEVYRTLHTEV